MGSDLQPLGLVVEAHWSESRLLIFLMFYFSRNSCDFSTVCSVIKGVTAAQQSFTERISLFFIFFFKVGNVY